MAIRTVLRMGEPCLLQVAKPVEQFNQPQLFALIQDLEDTMAAMQGAGIAAPQIGISERVVIFGDKTNTQGSNPRYPDADVVPYTVLVNPEIMPLTESMVDGWEGCLSVPGMRGVVPRYEEIHYRGYDQFGNKIDRKVSGFHARVVQHECDHLDGILYPMKIKDLKDFGFVDVIFPEQNVDEG